MQAPVYEKYAAGHSGMTVTSAEGKMQRVFDDNLAAANLLVADSGRSIPLLQQLQGKRYVFTVDEVKYLPIAGN